MPGARRMLFIALGALVVVGAGAAVAFAADINGHDGRVLRNTTLAGHDVGGLDAVRLRAVVDDIGRRYADDVVKVRAPGGGLEATGAELGLAVDPAATTRAALQAGRSGSLPARFTGWLRSFTSQREVEVRVAADPAAVRRIVAERDKGPRTPPVEPAVHAKEGGGGFVVTTGKPGKGIDAGDVVDALPDAAARGSAVVVDVDRREIKPRFSHEDAAALGKRAESATAKPLVVTAGAVTASVPPATLRTWVHSEVGEDALTLVVDRKKALDSLGKLLAKAATPATQTTFVIAGNTPQPKFGTPGAACCSDEAAASIERALLGAEPRPSAPLKLALKPVPPKITADNLAALGIKQQVSTFTTNHPAGQPRVTNIHRIADIVKGQVILPGETFSVNAFVGERTVAKGFVVDHQINDEGKFDDAVGGGVSQFATTTFNAAFFAGLDFGEYQSHTIYISRYPYGREATISWQHPDLQLKNTTPYAVLIWASYTNTSLTISMWSTPHLASVAQSDQTKTQFGPGCTRVKTERTRQYLDGRSVVDHFFANYQPAEGVKCR